MVPHHENIDTRITIMQKNAGNQNKFDITSTGNFLDYLFACDRGGVYQKVLNRQKIRVGRVEQEAPGASFDETCFSQNTEFPAGYSRSLFGTVSNFSGAECEVWVKDKQAHNLNLGLSTEDVGNRSHTAILLLECYFTTDFFNLLFKRLRFFFLHVRFKHRGRGIHQIFGFLETKTENFFNYLNDSDFIGAAVSKLNRCC